MLVTEFEAMTDIYPDNALWNVINRYYNDSGMDKEQFCEDYVNNVDGIAQEIQTACNEEAARAEAAQREKLLKEYGDTQIALGELRGAILKELMAMAEAEFDDAELGISVKAYYMLLLRLGGTSCTN